MTTWPKQARCQCGDLTVTVLGPPRSAVACHCTDCQRRTGSAFGISIVFDLADVTVKAEDCGTYQRISDGGETVQQRFCRPCGTTVLWQADVHPGLIVVAGGAFDDTSWVAPAFHAWTRTGQDWFHRSGDLPRYARTPWHDDADTAGA